MPLGAAVRIARQNPRVLGAVVTLVVAELVVRGVVAVLLSSAWAILVPPVVLVVGVAGLVPAFRTARAGDSSGEPARWWTRPPIVSAVIVAVGGHAAALVLGTALFLAVDTPVRMALYWTGNGDLINALVVLVAPIVGIEFGTFVAWGVVASAVAGVADGMTARAALRRALGAPLASPRRALVGAAWGAAAALAHLAATALAVASTIDFESSMITSQSPSIPVLAAGVGLAVLAGSVCLWLALSTLAGDAPDRSIAGPSAVRVGLVVVLVLSAVGGASAVRLTETQPTMERAALPDDPGEMYGTAIENTQRSNYHFRVGVLNADSPNSTVGLGIEWWFDRTGRRFRQAGWGDNGPGVPKIYASTATTHMPPMFSGDLSVPHRRGPGFFPPTYHFWNDALHRNAEVPLVDATADDDWRVANRTDDRVVLTITDPEAVLNASEPRLPADRITDVERARIQAVIDTETATIRRVEERVNATVHHDDYENDSRRYDAHVEATFRVGIDIERPEEFGPRTPIEWFWKLMAY
jgi:hypothetical protein